jgi:Fe-S cluster biosynthesis and repair protein YggX
MWLEHSKMLINEYRLDLVTPEAFQLLHERCEAFFFGEREEA